MARSQDMPPDASGYASSLVKNQFLTKIPRTPSGIDLTGQVAIVTGASSGLGLESSRQLLSLGLSHLIMAVRSPKRGQAAADQIRAANPLAKVELWPLEMESYESVQSFARRCETEFSRLDIAILNAGIAEMDFKVVPATGHEMTMQVNYQSTMLLALLLLPILKTKATAGVTPHLTVTNSAMSGFAKLPNRDKRPFLRSFDDTNITAWDPQDRYNASKLAGQFFLSRVADVVSANDVIINMVEPGLTKGTGLFRNVRGIAGAVFSMIKAASARTIEQGAWTYIDAVAIKGMESHGCYLANCQIGP